MRQQAGTRTADDFSTPCFSSSGPAQQPIRAAPRPPRLSQRACAVPRRVFHQSSAIILRVTLPVPEFDVHHIPVLVPHDLPVSARDRPRDPSVCFIVLVRPDIASASLRASGLPARARSRVACFRTRTGIFVCCVHRAVHLVRNVLSARIGRSERVRES